MQTWRRAMFDELAGQIGKETSAGLAFEELKAIHAIDRWFTFSAFKKSAAHAASRWRDHGLAAVKVESFPADGRTRVASWLMPFSS